MVRIRELLLWSYGKQRRHLLLIAGLAIGGIHLYVANATNLLHPVLAIAPFLAVGAVLYGLGSASRPEQFTIAIWSVAAWLGFGLLGFALHNLVAPQHSFSQFITAHSLGLILGILMSLGLITALLAAVTSAATVLHDKKFGGNNGSTPEERILTDHEYEDFEPIEETKCLVANKLYFKA
jgi:hypothetical protein